MRGSAKKGFIESCMAAAEGRELCRVLFDGSPDAILLADPKTGLIIDANAAAEKLTGHKQEDLLGSHYTTLHQSGYDGPARALFNLHVSGAAEKTPPPPLRCQLLRADGSQVAVEITAKLINVNGRKVVQGFFRDVTANLRAEKDLRESEEKFRLLAEKALVGVYLIQDGLFRYSNPVHARIFGYESSEITGKLGPRDLVQPEDWPLVESNIKRRISGEKEEMEYSFRGRRRDGRAIYLETRGTRTEYMGRPALIGTIMDVTERRKAEAALRESENMYRTLIDTARVGIVVHERGAVRLANRAMADMIGASGPEELAGRSVLDFVHPDCRPFVAGRIGRAPDSGPLPAAEEKLVTLGGEILEVEINTAPITYKGTPCALAIVHDVTARRQAEQEMKKAHRQLLDIIEFLPDATFVIDRAKRVIAWNRALERMTGVRKEDMLGKGDYAYSVPFHGERRPLLIDLINESAPETEKLYDFVRRDTDGTVRAEVFVPTLYNGEGAYLAGTASPLLDEDGRRYGAIESLRDITERKKIQADMLRLNADLERRVAERTAQLERANRELESFAYSAAHDLKSPLRHIQIFAELLEQEAGAALTKDSQVNLHNMRRSSEQLGRLVESLLALASAGSKPLAMQPVDLGALAREAAAEAAGDTGGRAIELDIRPLPRAVCDRVLIKQVLVNLLSNAVKYTRRAPEARISVYAETQAGECVVTVKDNGVGFDQAAAGRLFGFFQRLHRQEEFEGTGIGLSTVKRIVARHGGRVWAEGGPDGAAFHFTLPMNDG